MDVIVLACVHPKNRTKRVKVCKVPTDWAQWRLSVVDKQLELSQVKEIELQSLRLEGFEAWLSSLETETTRRSESKKRQRTSLDAVEAARGSDTDYSVSSTRGRRRTAPPQTPPRADRSASPRRSPPRAATPPPPPPPPPVPQASVVALLEAQLAERRDENTMLRSQVEQLNATVLSLMEKEATSRAAAAGASGALEATRQELEFLRRLVLRQNAP